MRVTVLTGGTSAERDVALASAVQVIGALRSRGHEVAVVDTARGYIPEADERRCCRGIVGIEPPSIAQLQALERGLLLSGLGNLAGGPERRRAVPCTPRRTGRGRDDPDAAGDGGRALHRQRPAGERHGHGQGHLQAAVPRGRGADRRLGDGPRSTGQVDREFGWPVVVKPSKQGSTVGLTVVKRPRNTRTPVALARQYDDEVMIERFVPGRELTVGVLEGRALAVGEIIPRHEIFDYECKYTPGMSQEIFPADLPEPLAAECGRLSLLAHEALKLGGYSRVDFRLTPAGELFCLEVNTLPGMTATSLLPQSARAVGIEFPELCERICRAARRGRPRGTLE